MGIPAAHGGKLVDRVVREPRLSAALEEARGLPKIALTDEKLKDVENIATGVFSPLEGFMNEDGLLSIIRERRLVSGVPWTIPIVLDVDDVQPETDRVALTSNGRVVATMEVESVYSIDKKLLAERTFGTTDPDHPGVARTLAMKGKIIGGKVDLLAWVDDRFSQHRLSPAQVRASIEQKNLKTVVGFQTRNVPHIGHEYLQKLALTLQDGLFVNPVIGRKKVGDFRDEVIIETYRVLLDKYYRRERVIFGILETEMRYAGPMEAIFHAIVRKNFGCSHIIIGRDHAGVGNYYGPYAAREIFAEFPDLGIAPLPFDELFYCTSCEGLASDRICPHDATKQLRFSGTKIREIFKSGKSPPPQFMRPEVSQVVLSHPEPFIEQA